MIQIGVDFGGTKVEAAALDASGKLLAKARVPNPGDYDKALVVVRELVTGLERQLGARGTLGIGAPGSISPSTGVMRNANSLYLNGRRFREDLSEALQRPVRLANDANCLALSEAVDGAGAGAKVVFAIILGTGCGGGLVVDGKLIEGENGIAGEWGHMPLPWPTIEEREGPRCWCGQNGCLEMWVSGTGLRRDFQASTGRTLSGEEIITAWRAGDPAATTAFDQFMDRLSRSVAVLCNILDPDAIVIGGGLSNVPEVHERLPDLVARRVFADRWSTRIKPAVWGDASGVRGAARLWSQDEARQLLAEPAA
ncbi:ROK family protein [Caulobacter radicis]|uniref:Fructokinase n=1 Tax=Caulobacter radicis TaxID=2172650 RepID=A0A2T9J808_9CAUL|nr:ROK family protein [Caulobacter radicis]PVM77662.1 fructokinase [Caulobacter radicis]